MKNNIDLIGKVLVHDPSRFNEVLNQALINGQAVIRDGVAYWQKGSGYNGIIQHLPFKEIDVKSMEHVKEIAQLTASTAAVSAAISTGVILAALVVQTKYLANKLDSIQETVDQISKDIDSQNIIYYMDKISEYIGGVEVARTLLSNRDIANEIKEVSYPLLVDLATKRNHNLSFIDNILNLAKSKDAFTKKYYELIFNCSGLEN